MKPARTTSNPVPAPPARDAILPFFRYPINPPTIRRIPYGIVKQKSCIIFSSWVNGIWVFFLLSQIDLIEIVSDQFIRVCIWIWRTRGRRKKKSASAFLRQRSLERQSTAPTFRSHDFVKITNIPRIID